LLWDVHQDTVPVDGMTVDPLAASVRAMAVFTAVALRCKRVDGSDARRHFADKPGATLADDRDCLHGERGMWIYRRGGLLHLCSPQDRMRRLSAERFRRRMFPPPDAAIVAEPTDFNVVVAHQGVVRCVATRSAERHIPHARGDQPSGAIGLAMNASVTRGEWTLPSALRRPTRARLRRGGRINTVPERATIEMTAEWTERTPETAYGAWCV
jgi:hypothetical protein